jgi:hypothetical protein
VRECSMSGVPSHLAFASALQPGGGAGAATATDSMVSVGGASSGPWRGEMRTSWTRCAPHWEAT